MKRFPVIALLFYAMGASANTAGIDYWQFEILLDGKKIGYHDFTVNHAGGRQTVTMEAKFDVKLLFVKVFDYKHQNEEVWRDNCLASIDARTVSNGRDYLVRGQQAGGEFQLEAPSAEVELPPCVKSFAYWNPDFLKAERLLNSQTGDYEEVSITEECRESVLIDGKEIQAIKYSLTGAAAPLTLWYSAEDHRWLALESELRGGRILRYNPLQLPGSLAAPHNSGE